MIPKIIAERIGLRLAAVTATIRLLDEGATIPFISRYRKEATGSLDEVQVGEIKLLYDKLTELESRKKSILTTIEEQGKLTTELREKITNCFDSTELEDIYLPYKPKRRTRATIARENGLEPLADLIWAQNVNGIDRHAEKHLNKTITTVEAAISGACDIVAERISESTTIRTLIRRAFDRDGVIVSKLIKGKESEGVKFSDYFNLSTPLRKLSSHRFLAIQRGEAEGILRLSIDIDGGYLVDQICNRTIKSNSRSGKYIRQAAEDSYKRLIRPSIENETIGRTKERADDAAISIFADNLRQLLLSSPLGEHRIMAIDPGFRTGCKVVVLDAQCNLIHNTTIYPHPPQSNAIEAAESIRSLVKKYKVEAFAIGDGTAGRETKQFIESLSIEPDIYMVNEDGASVYSASAVAREEFPEYDVTVRGAVSIGRRLIDPLSELVKIDPKSIGVGQYQHSVDQSKLKNRLTTVVESCVNQVGVNINTASKHILTYISGLGPTLASNIVNYRAANGEFSSRRELLKVPRLGAKAYEQAAGFLRVIGGKNLLDNSAVHPESYHIVELMARDSGVKVEKFIADSDIRKNVDRKRYITPEVGLPTINYIFDALDKRGLDPREPLTKFEFDANIKTIEDLREGMQLPGTVTNITAFGAFVNIGIKQDGLVHISQLADRFVSSPSDVVQLGQHVTVRVVEVDLTRGRIGLSMRL
ncbi:MAG: Tex family protein [Rikenellaceae bacterium]